jgi:hypothetical protein
LTRKHLCFTFGLAFPVLGIFFFFIIISATLKKYFHVNIRNEIPIYRDYPRKINFYFYGQVSQGVPDQNFRRKDLVPERVIVSHLHCIRNVELSL